MEFYDLLRKSQINSNSSFEDPYRKIKLLMTNKIKNTSTFNNMHIAKMDYEPFPVKPKSSNMELKPAMKIKSTLLYHTQKTKIPISRSIQRCLENISNTKLNTPSNSPTIIPTNSIINSKSSTPYFNVLYKRQHTNNNKISSKNYELNKINISKDQTFRLPNNNSSKEMFNNSMDVGEPVTDFSDKRSVIHSETFTQPKPYLNISTMSNLNFENEHHNTETNIKEIPGSNVLCENISDRNNLHSNTEEINLNNNKKKDLNEFMKRNNLTREICPIENQLYQCNILENNKFGDNIYTDNRCSPKSDVRSPFNVSDKSLEGIKDSYGYCEINNYDKCASDICKMLNDLLKDLDITKVDNNNVKDKSDFPNIDISSGNKLDNLKLYEEFPKTYTKLCNKAFGDVSSIFNQSYQSSNPSTENQITGKLVSDLRKPLLIQKKTGYETYSENSHSPFNYDTLKTPDVKERTFVIDPCDDLIKSHLSQADRRIRSISKKFDCTIKITGPFSYFSNKTRSNRRNKVLYYCHLISESMEKTNICLKCLQNAFPLTRLREIHSQALIYRDNKCK